jgi:hypothetical protein
LNGLYAGVVASVLLVAWVRPELAQVFMALGGEDWAKVLVDARPKISFAWFYPVTAAIVFGVSCLPLGGYAKRGVKS